MGWGKVDLGTVLKDERAALSIVLAYFLEGSPSDNVLWSSDVNEVMLAAEMRHCL